MTYNVEIKYYHYCLLRRRERDHSYSQQLLHSFLGSSSLQHELTFTFNSLARGRLSRMIQIICKKMSNQATIRFARQMLHSLLPRRTSSLQHELTLTCNRFEGARILFPSTAAALA